MRGGSAAVGGSVGPQGAGGTRGVGRTTDVGLPLARTALAWQRTALSAAGLCVAGAVVWTRLGLPGPAVAAAVVAVLPMVALTRRGALAGRSVWDRMLAVVGAAVVLAVLGVAAAVLGLR